MDQQPRKIRIGTRGSRLALWQADHVAAKLRALGCEAAIEVIQTLGDRDRVRDFGSLGAKGIFVKEIEEALLAGRIDWAVHSCKDLPTALPEGLALGAVLERADARDALVSEGGLRLDELPAGATVATGSLRRAAQALHERPDLKIVPIRGNVPTRIEKIRAGEAAATLLAAAGLDRLGLEGEIAERFDVDRMTPAMGQGAVAIECRAGEFADLLAAIQHEPSRAAIEAERRFIARVGGGCRTPGGAHARIDAEGRASFFAMLASADGRSLLRERIEVDRAADLVEAAEALARKMLDAADEAILATLDPAPAEIESP